VGSKTEASLSIPFNDLSTGSVLPAPKRDVAARVETGATGENAEAAPTKEAIRIAVENFMVVIRICRMGKMHENVMMLRQYDTRRQKRLSSEEAANQKLQQG
jgi:hypothetical protein